jgi:hypothetical protein
MDHDPVSHPNHYTQGAVECIDAIESALGPEDFIAFLQGQVLKYMWRFRCKDNPLQDLQKADWYLKLLLKRVGEYELSQKNNPLGHAQKEEQDGTKPRNTIDSCRGGFNCLYPKCGCLD